MGIYPKKNGKGNWRRLVILLWNCLEMVTGKEAGKKAEWGGPEADQRTRLLTSDDFYFLSEIRRKDIF